MTNEFNKQPYDDSRSRSQCRSHYGKKIDNNKMSSINIASAFMILVSIVFCLSFSPSLCVAVSASSASVSALSPEVSAEVSSELSSELSAILSPSSTTITTMTNNKHYQRNNKNNSNINSSSNNTTTATTTTTTTILPPTTNNYNNNIRVGKIVGRNSCDSLTTCDNCTNTYSCHWCKKSKSCHARGSFYGCAWGESCSPKPPPPKKENTTCASQTTCSDCGSSSRLCHWCEVDNACHAIGSRYGCAVGVDCYSNDRCRRSESEKLPGISSSPTKAPIDYILAILNRVPSMSLIVIIIFGIMTLSCLCCCHYFTSNVKGAYDDLATITMAASVAPMSIIGGQDFTAGQFYTRLESTPEEVGMEEEDDDDANDNENSNNNGNNNNNNNNTNGDGDGATIEQPSSQIPERNADETIDVNNQDQDRQQQQQQQHQQDVGPNEDINDDPYYLIDDDHHPQRTGLLLRNRGEQEHNGPLLHPPFNNGSIIGGFNGSVYGMEEPLHMKNLYRLCSIIYYLSIIVVISVLGTCVFMYPQRPVYNICNDEVAWTGIMKNMVAFKFETSFEILGSLSNPNRIDAILDRGKGSFSFEGKQFGRFEVPPVTVEAMAITDFMIVVHVSPADRQQAIQLAEAYYLGKLIIEAEFEGTIRIPALFDYTREILVKGIMVDINAHSDRSLCHCKPWDGKKNHTKTVTMIEEQLLPSFMLDKL